MSKLVRDHFDREALSFDRVYGGKGAIGSWIDRTFRHDMQERWRLTLEACGDLDGKSILDVGCGGGRYSVDFAKRGAAKVVGIDLAPGMVELANKLALEEDVGPRCEFLTGEFMDVSFEERFDVSVAMGVLDYIAEPAVFLEKMADVSKELVLLSFPSFSPLRGPLRQVRYRIMSCPLYLYREEDVIALLKPLGQFYLNKIPGHGMDYFAAVRLGGRSQ